MAAGDLLLDADGNLVLDADGNLGIHDGVTDECCCDSGADCCDTIIIVASGSPIALTRAGLTWTGSGWTISKVAGTWTLTDGANTYTNGTGDCPSEDYNDWSFVSGSEVMSNLFCFRCPPCEEAETSNELLDGVDVPETTWPANESGCSCGVLGALATGMSAWMTHRDTNALTGPIPAPSCNESITDWLTDERENVDYREYVLLSKVWQKVPQESPTDCCYQFIVQWVMKHCYRVKVDGDWVYYCCERSSYQTFNLCYVENESGQNVTVTAVGDVQGDVGFGAASVTFPAGPYSWPPLPLTFTGITATVTGLVGADVDIDFDLTVCPEGV